MVNELYEELRNLQPEKDKGKRYCYAFNLSCGWEFQVSARVAWMHGLQKHSLRAREWPSQAA